MKLVVEPCRALPLVQITVAFPAGAAHEPSNLAGLARLTARMLRRGAGGLSAQAIEERIDALGGELSTHVGLGSTAVSCEVLRRHVEPACELIALLLAEPSFDEAELGRLVRQATAEIVESRDDDGLLAARALRRHLFAGHPHGRRPSGSLASLARIGTSDVRAFHASALSRAGAIVALSGDIDAEEAARAAERVLAGLSEGARQPYPAADPGPPSARHMVVVDKPERTQTQLVVGTLGADRHDADYDALLVASCAFGGTMSSRMMQEVRVKRGWSYGASASLQGGRVREAFTMWTAPAAEDAAACLALELALLERLVDAGINDDELCLTQDYLRRSYAFEVDTARKRAGQAIERALLDLPDDWHARFIERVSAVTRADAHEALRRRLSSEDLWVSAVATHSEIGDALAAAVPRLCESLIEPFDFE